MSQWKASVALACVTILSGCSDTVAPKERDASASTVAPVGEPTVASASTPSVFLTQGNSATLNIVGLVDASRLRNERVTWTSRSPASVSVDRSTGVAKGLVPGRAWVIEAAGGVSDSILVAVLPLNGFRISPDTGSVTVGTSVTITPDIDIPLRWSSSDSSVASIVNGVVTALKPGSVRITATSPIQTTAIANLTVPATAADPTTPAPPSTPPSTPSTPTTPPSTPAPSTVELPRVYLDDMVAEARSATVARTINVADAAALLAALDTSKYGDEIVLRAGVTYAGLFILKRKSGTGWITIRSNAPAAQLPVANARMRPSYAASLPKIVAQYASDTPIQTEAGAHNYRFFAVEVTGAPLQTFGNALISLGSGDRDQNTLASQPYKFVLDRVYIHGTPSLDFKRCVALNSASTAIVDSWLSECHGRGYDSQAIWGSNGVGPYKIVNNYLEGAGENVMFGGSDPQIPNALPADIEIRKNHFFKPPSWKGVWSVKNLFELKIGLRVLVEGNIFENNWVDGQSGFAILFKSTNQDNSAPWSQSADVTFRSNIVRNVAHGLSAAGHPETYPVVLAARINITNNSFEKIGSGDYEGGRLWQVSQVDNLTFSHNSGFGITHGMILYGPQMANLTMTDNVFGTTQTNYDQWNFALSSADGVGYGTTALNYHVTNWVFKNNLMPGVNSTLFPNSSIAADFGSLGLTGWPTDLRLPATSPFLQSSTTGGAPGVDFTLLSQATAGVIVTP